MLAAVWTMVGTKPEVINANMKYVPDGLEFKEQEVSGEIEHIQTLFEGVKFKEKEFAV